MGLKQNSEPVVTISKQNNQSTFSWNRNFWDFWEQKFSPLGVIFYAMVRRNVSLMIFLFPYFKKASITKITAAHSLYYLNLSRRAYGQTWYYFLQFFQSVSV